MKWALGAALLWALCIGFTLGIFIRSFTAVPQAVLLCMGACALLAVLAGAADAKKLRYALVFAALVFACGGGVLRMGSAIVTADPAVQANTGTRVSLEGIVADEPDVRPTQVRVPVRIIATEPETTVLAVFPAHTEIYYGAHVRVSGILQLPKSFEAGAGREFNYPGYLAARGIIYELGRASLEEVGGFEGNPIVASAYAVKHFFVLGLERALPEPHAGLAGGITVGEKKAMGKDLTEIFQTVSLVHIVVLSGYNITVVISALFWLLSSSPRYVRFGAGGLVALFFAVMTGFASASLRAALMALISISGSLSGRMYRADRALALVATLMILWNPYLLVFDPGFQLSFLACMGLIIFSPIFARYFSFASNTLGIKEILASSCSAQIAVLPLILYQSGNLSLVSLPANLLVLAAVPPAMLFSAVAAIGGLLLEPLAALIGFPAYALLSYILAVAHYLAAVPFASVTLPAFSAAFLVPIYGALFAYGLREHQKEKPRYSSAVFPGNI